MFPWLPNKVGVKGGTLGRLLHHHLMDMEGAKINLPSKQKGEVGKSGRVLGWSISQ